MDENKEKKRSIIDINVVVTWSLVDVLKHLYHGTRYTFTARALSRFAFLFSFVAGREKTHSMGRRVKKGPKMLALYAMKCVSF